MHCWTEAIKDLLEVELTQVLDAGFIGAGRQAAERGHTRDLEQPQALSHQGGRLESTPHVPENARTKQRRPFSE